MWYKEWFDSEYYHILYRHRDEKEAEHFIDLIAEHCGLKPGMKVLDLPCGKGRHSVYLEKKGFMVTGADLSPNSIEYAKSQSTPRLHFLVHNMLHPFPENGFDAVMNLFTSFGYFDDENDDLKALKNMKDALKPGGVLIIDFLNPEEVKRNLIEEQLTEIDGIRFNIKKRISQGFVEKNVSFSADGQDFTFCEKVRLFNLAELSEMLIATGLQIIGIFGDYSLGNYSKTESDRLILIARKN